MAPGCTSRLRAWEHGSSGVSPDVSMICVRLLYALCMLTRMAASAPVVTPGGSCGAPGCEEAVAHWPAGSHVRAAAAGCWMRSPPGPCKVCWRWSAQAVLPEAACMRRGTCRPHLSNSGQCTPPAVPVVMHADSSVMCTDMGAQPNATAVSMAATLALSHTARPDQQGHYTAGNSSI